MTRIFSVALLATALGIGCKSAWLEADGGPLEGTGPHAKYGFVTFEQENRIWVFRHGSKELQDYAAKGEPAKHVTLIGRGPQGKTVRAPDSDTAYDFLYGKPGFVVWPDPENRLWIFKRDAKELQDYYAKGELAKHVTRIGAGPGGMTVKAPDAATIDDYLQASVVP